MKRLVLVGAGHAHAQVLKDWIAAPLREVELVLVSPSALAPYSGMVPGWLEVTTPSKTSVSISLRWLQRRGLVC